MNLKQRLEKYKANAENLKARYPESFYSWKNNRYPKPQVLKRNPISRSQDDKTIIYTDNLESIVATVQDATGLSSNVSSWYADNSLHNLVIPVVVGIRNPHVTSDDESENSHLFFYPAIRYSECDGATLYTETAYSTKLEAAYAADRIAEHHAEQCREDDAKDRAEQRIEENREQIHAINKELLPLINDLKQACESLSEPLRKALKAQVYDQLRERKECFSEIQKYQADYWEAVQY